LSSIQAFAEDLILPKPVPIKYYTWMPMPPTKGTSTVGDFFAKLAQANVQDILNKIKVNTPEGRSASRAEASLRDNTSVKVKTSIFECSANVDIFKLKALVSVKTPLVDTFFEASPAEEPQAKVVYGNINYVFLVKSKTNTLGYGIKW
jgi:hypothetical protein